MLGFLKLFSIQLSLYSFNFDYNEIISSIKFLNFVALFIKDNPEDWLGIFHR